jgi:ABC-type Fe3+/spermidine/putrescine transport system ATPase subunit
VANFFGSVNWLSGRLVHENCVETKIGRFDVCLKGSPAPDVLLGFRPEALKIVSRDDQPRRNSFAASLRSSTFLGDQCIYDAVVGDQLLTGKSRVMPSDHAMQLYVDPSDIMVFPGSESEERLQRPYMDLRT